MELLRATNFFSQKSKNKSRTVWRSQSVDGFWLLWWLSPNFSCLHFFLFKLFYFWFFLQFIVLLVWSIFLRIYLGYNWSCFLLHCPKNHGSWLCVKKGKSQWSQTRRGEIAEYINMCQYYLLGKIPKKQPTEKCNAFSKLSKSNCWAGVNKLLSPFSIGFEGWIFRGHYIEHHQFLFRSTAVIYK